MSRTRDLPGVSGNVDGGRFEAVPGLYLNPGGRGRSRSVLGGKGISPWWFSAAAARERGELGAELRPLPMADTESVAEGEAAPLVQGPRLERAQRPEDPGPLAP